MKRPEKNTIQMTFRIPAEDLEALNLTADSRKTKTTDIARAALREEINKIPCPICGESVPQKSRYCLRCGTALTEDAAESQRIRAVRDAEIIMAAMKRSTF
ncbi:MAG TPA: zinc ribbon domain-containing protein [Methanocorpusculum sp.]|nr:zinc ribbon domain-containing protein [Methanocorpusculum sp.]